MGKRVFSRIFDKSRVRHNETKLRFDMGLNEFKSLESNVGFFSNGTVIAFFWLVGRDHWSNDALHLHAITQLTCFTSQVGTGSRRSISKRPSGEEQRSQIFIPPKNSEWHGRKLLMILKSIAKEVNRWHLTLISRQSIPISNSFGGE
jgi:hypothetical protein